MKFRYKQTAPAVVTPDSKVIHEFSLEGGHFVIEASRDGVRFTGTSQYFQPVNEEMKIPDSFREFMTRLSYAFEVAFSEQAREAKEAEGRRALLGSIHN